LYSRDWVTQSNAVEKGARWGVAQPMPSKPEKAKIRVAFTHSLKPMQKINRGSFPVQFTSLLWSLCGIQPDQTHLPKKLGTNHPNTKLVKGQLDALKE
jgi:hypothetical protein